LTIGFTTFSRSLVLHFIQCCCFSPDLWTCARTFQSWSIIQWRFLILSQVRVPRLFIRRSRRLIPRLLQLFLVRHTWGFPLPRFRLRILLPREFSFLLTDWPLILWWILVDSIAPRNLPILPLRVFSQCSRRPCWFQRFFLLM
jgi:hypothetical protein